MSETSNIYEFIQRFPDERSAIEHLESRRWSNGVICPKCDSKNIYDMPDYRYHECRDCDKVFTVRSNSIFERSHVPMHKWLLAMHLMQVNRKGINSVQLSKTIGVTQKTAWTMLQKLRETCQPNPEKLSGEVEIDETYVGGKVRNKEGGWKGRRGVADKQPVLGFRERNGRVVALPVTDTKAHTLEREIDKWVEPGTLVYTDAHGGYINLHKKYRHTALNKGSGDMVRGSAHTQNIESIWAVLKRGYKGVYHTMSRKHLQRYVDEFAFRLTHQDPMKALDEMILNAFGKRLTYKELIA